MDHLQNVMGYFDQQQPLCAEHDRISKDLYKEFGVKAGLRDENGKGVLAGLTNISDIRAFQYVDGVKKPADGQLLYRGYDVKDLIRGSSGSRFAFEEAGYLLLFGELPTQEKLEEFCRVLGECRTMPTNFTRDVIMKAPSHDIMNSMARSVLTLASYDPKAGDLEISNVLRQSIQLAGIFPMLAVYSYHAYNHYEKDGSMYIHRPDPELSTAENFLRMLRPDMKYTELEARVLDVALLLHAEHGGGNNSTFTTRVVTSSGTDTYSAMAAALCSLKGPRHGGANLMVMQMMQNIRENLHDTEDDEELEAYLKKLLHGEAFDRKGLRPQSRLRYVPPLSGALVPASRKPRLVRLVTACNDLPQLFYIAVNVCLHPCHRPVRSVVRMEAVCHVHSEDRQPQVFFRYQLWK